jgi:PTH1 family peptidyl-tRNA hydrolase
MIAFIGLGNVGDSYTTTKHNAGFWVVNELARRMNLAFKPGRGDFVYAQKKRGDLLLAKPTTGMNGSGLAVRAIKDQWSLAFEDIHVIVDDVDLPLGSLRIRPYGGDGSHRGMESVIYQLGEDRFPRLRIGIKTSEITRPAEKFVLKPFLREDQLLAEDMVQRTADAAETILRQGLQTAMNKYNRTQHQQLLANEENS